MTSGKVVLVPFPFDDLSTTTVTTALIQWQLGELSPAWRARVAERLVKLFEL